ncbi:MAG: HEPN domain-containing protein [Leucobacter sp.]
MKKLTAWPPVGVTQRMIELKELQDLVRSTSGGEDYASHLDRYLVVRSAGLIEAVRDDVADQHSRMIGTARLHKRIADGLRNGLGVRPNQLIDFVRTFDQQWSEELEGWLAADDGNRKNQLGALVAARKKIAHGDGAGVSSRQALSWADIALETSKWLVARFDPN